MTRATRFLFDVSFDEPDEAGVAVAEVAEEVPPEEVVEAAPVFSEEELTAARAEAFAAGREQAAREAASSQERRVADAMVLIGERMEGLFQAQREALVNLNGNATAIASAVTRKIFPELNRRNGLDEIARLVQLSLERVMDEPRIVIHVNPELRDHLSGRIQELQQRSGFDGKLVLLADPGTAFGDCRLEWAEGGAERNTAALWHQIDGIIEGYLDATCTSLAGEGALSQPVLGEPSEPTSTPTAIDEEQQEDFVAESLQALALEMAATEERRESSGEDPESAGETADGVGLAARDAAIPENVADARASSEEGSASDEDESPTAGG